MTDDVAGWTRMLQSPQVSQGKKIRPTRIDDVIRGDMYLEALLAWRLNWGGWEVHHASPPADPLRYRDTDGVLLTHAFNRAYTVGSEKTFAAFRSPAGLAMVRHYPLNENMMFDATYERTSMGHSCRHNNIAVNIEFGVLRSKTI